MLNPTRLSQPPQQLAADILRLVLEVILELHDDMIAALARVYTAHLKLCLTSKATFISFLASLWRNLSAVEIVALKGAETVLT